MSDVQVNIPIYSLSWAKHWLIHWEFDVLSVMKPNQNVFAVSSLAESTSATVMKAKTRTEKLLEVMHQCWWKHQRAKVLGVRMNFNAWDSTPKRLHSSFLEFWAADFGRIYYRKLDIGNLLYNMLSSRSELSARSWESVACVQSQVLSLGWGCRKTRSHFKSTICLLFNNTTNLFGEQEPICLLKITTKEWFWSQVWSLLASNVSKTTTNPLSHRLKAAWKSCKSGLKTMQSQKI